LNRQDAKVAKRKKRVRKERILLKNSLFSPFLLGVLGVLAVQSPVFFAGGTTTPECFMKLQDKAMGPNRKPLPFRPGRIVDIAHNEEMPQNRDSRDSD
jgi:hypothetical protein